MNKKLLLSILLIAFFVSFFSQKVSAQGVIDFDPAPDITGQAIKSISVDGFTFAATIANSQFNIGFNNGAGFNNSWALIDGNIDVGGLTRWTITRDGGSEFQFREVWIFNRDPGTLGTSVSGTIRGYKNGTPTGSAKPINFNGVQSFASDPDFFDVDEIRIEAADIYVAIDNFTFGSVFTPVDTDPTEVTSIFLTGNPLSNASSVTYSVNFSKTASNVSTDDFQLTSNGSANGTIASVSGSGTAYTLTVNNITGEGGLRLDLKANTNISNTNGNQGTPAYTSGQTHFVSSCLIETFEDEIIGSKVFTSGTNSFTITGDLEINTEVPNPGIGGSRNVLKNTGGGTYTITSNDDLVFLNSIAFYLSSDVDGSVPTGNGTLTLRGKRNGVVQFSTIKNTGFETGSTNNGYNLIDFATISEIDYSTIAIDQFEIEIGGSFVYLNIDNFGFCADTEAPSGYSVSIDQDPINLNNQDNVSFTFADAEIGTRYNYTFSSSGGGTNVTGSGNVSREDHKITGIDLSGLPEGTITLNVTLTDISENTGDIQTDNSTKTLNPFIEGRRIDYRENEPPVSFSSGGEIIVLANGVNISEAVITFLDEIEGDVLTVGDTSPFSVTTVDDVITLSGPGTAAQMSAALNSITYEHDGNDPGRADTDNSRAVEIFVEDVLGKSSPTIRIDIGITGVNDDPTIVSLPSDATVIENTASNLDLSAATFSDVDAGTSPISLTLEVNTGILTTTPGTGMVIDGSGTESITLTGSQFVIDEYLNTPANIKYTGPVGVTGNNEALLTVSANDGGNTGEGNGTSVFLDEVIIDIVPANNPPTVANPISDQDATQDVLFSFTFAEITFNDADGDPLTYTAQLSEGGELPVWLSFDEDTRTFAGTPLNASVGTVTIDLTANDGNGGTVTDIFDITVANVNDAPTIANAILDQNATEDTAFNFQFAANTFEDIDLGDVLTYTAQISGGSPLPAWLSFDPATRTFSGTPGNSDSGVIIIEVIANDGELSVSDSFNLTVEGINDAPVITAALSISVFEDEPEALTGISFTDVDAGTSDVVVTFEVGSGTLAASSTGVVEVGGNSTNLTLTGSLDEINSFLANEELTFTTSLNSTENVNLAIEIDDQGNTGSGGAKTDNAILTLEVTAVNDAPVNTVPGSQNVDQNGTLTFSAANSNQLSVSDVDLGPAPNTIDITLTATNGVFTLANSGLIELRSGNAVASTEVVFYGSLPIVNDALDGVTFTPTPGFVGTASLEITSNDLGLSGSGGAQSDTDVISINVNPTNPVVTSVNSGLSNRAFKIGDELTLSVNFSEAVIVAGGTPQLTLETGTTDRVASYVSGSGTAVLEFIYTVQEGDFSPDLDYTGSSALDANGAEIQGPSSLLDAILTLPEPGAANSLAANKNFNIDGIIPTITSVSVPADQTYVTGETLDFTVNFSEAVQVSGNPAIGLTIGTATRQASYVSGSGSSALVFSYPVAMGDLDSDGITIAGSFSPNGGTLRDPAGNDATPTLNGVADTDQVLVDAVAPSIISLDLDNTSLAIGETAIVTLIFTEAVSGLNLPSFEAANGILTDLTSADGVTWTATFTPALNIEATTNVIELDNSSYEDQAGNTGSGTTNSNNYSIDTQRPTALVNVANPQLALGETTLVTISFSEPVTGLELNDFTVSNGTLSDLESLPGGNQWQTTLTPDPDVQAPNNLITLDNTGYQDLTGNTGTGVSNSNNYSIDTQIPSGYSLLILADRINGVNQNNFRFRLLDGEAGSDYSFSISSSAGGTPVTGNGEVTSSDQLISGIVVQGLPDGELILTVTLTDESGNEGAPVTETVEKLLPATLTIRVVEDGDEDGVDGQFVIETDNTLAAITVLELEVGGTATPGEDYTPIPIGIIFPGNTNSVLIPVTVIDDLDVEGDETVSIRLVRTDNSLVTLAQPSQATLTIADNDVPRQLTITPDANQQKVYGDDDPTTFSYTASGFDSGDDETIIQGSITRQAGEDAGTYSYSLGNLDAGPNYELVLNPEVFTITPKMLTIKAEEKSKVYGQANPALTFSYDGLVNEDTGIAVEPSISTAATASSPVGTYPITLTGGSDSNYAINLESGTLSITPADLTITADDKQKVFGAANPALTFSYDGLVNGDTELQTLPVLTSTATETSPVGNYPITVTGGSDPNYSVSRVNGILTIGQKTVTITAADQSKVYGQANPVLTFSYDGLLDGDTQIQTEPSISTETTISSTVGSYEITLTGGSDPNYDFVLVNGTMNITPASLTITADNQSKVYGEANPLLTFSYDGLVNGDTQLANEPSIETTATESSSVGNYPITLAGGSDPNYAISRVNGTFTIGQKAVTITAEDKTKVYGQANPVLTFTYDGLTNGDTQVATEPSIVTEAIINSPVGSYPITLMGGLDVNYAITLVNGSLTVTQAPLIITANDKSKVYGEANPILTFTYNGLVNGDTEVASEPSIASTAMESSNAGTYPITLNDGFDANYAITLIDGTLTIGQKALTITADDKSKFYGKVNPILTFNYDGLVNGDTEVDTEPNIATTATASSNVGTYPITLSGGSDNNYALTLVNGLLSVGQKELLITVDSDQMKVYGELDPTFTYTATGFENEDDEGILAGALTRQTGEEVGNYAIKQGDLSAGGNYTIEFTGSDFMISEKTLTITVDSNQSKVYGEADPIFTYTATGFENGDDESNIRGSLSREIGEIVGTYAIGLGSLNAGTNYTIDFTNSDFTIGTKVLSVTADAGQDKVYGESETTFTYTATGFENDDDESILSGSLTREAGEDVGMYAIQQGTLDAGSNYTIYFTNAYFEITPATIDGIIFDDVSFIFDGLEKNIEITGNFPAGTSVSYENNTRTNVGAQEATATITGPNYVTLILNAEMTIIPATITGVAFENGSFVYDGTAKSLEVSGLPDGAALSYANNGQTNAGTYEVAATVSRDNYNDLVLKAELTIEKAEAVIAADEVQTFTYDGDVKNVVASLNHTEAGLSFIPQQGYADAGTYVIEISSEATDNYLSASKEISLVIENTEIEGIIFEDASFVYDGTAKRLEVSGLPEGAIVSYANNGQTNAGSYTVTATIGLDNYDDMVLTANLLIDKASQEINFDAIADRNQQTDDNFQLGALASSGLQVIYSFDYETQQPAATVGPRGFVQILSAGTITITATQEGNGNYEAASPVTRTLSITGSGAKLNSVAINGTMYPNPDQEVYYLIGCEDLENEVQIQLQPNPGAFADRENGFTIAIPTPGIYRETVMVTSEDGNSTSTYTIIVEKNFNFEDIVIQKFNNVLLVNNNTNTNGGYKFVSYRWYKDGSVIGNGQYYSAGKNADDQLDPDSEYYVEVVTEDEEVLRTCISSVQLRSSLNVSLVPNPVSSGSTMELIADLPKEELETMQLSIHNLNGAFIEEIRSNRKSTQITVPYNLQIGVYLLKIKTKNISKTLKFIIK